MPMCGTGIGVGVGSGSVKCWTPRDLGSILKLWFNASNVNVVGGLVTGVTDLSGNGHDATAAGTEPVYEAAGFNGHPSMVFNGTDDCLVVPDHADLDVGTGAFFVAMAAEFLRDGSYEVFWGKGTSASADNVRLFHYAGPNGGIHIFPAADGASYGAASADITTSTKCVVGGGVVDGSHVRFVSNSVLEAEQAQVISGTGSNATDLYIGRDPAAYVCKFRMAEIVFLNSGAAAITTSQLTSLLTYLKAANGL
jgi:hypothetical protein